MSVIIILAAAFLPFVCLYTVPFAAAVIFLYIFLKNHLTNVL